MTTFYTLNNRFYYVPVEAIPRLTDAMCREVKTRDGKSIYVIKEGLPHYLREIFDNLGEYNFKQVVAIIHNRSHPLLNLGDEALRRIAVYAGPYRGFLHQICQTFFKRVAGINEDEKLYFLKMNVAEKKWDIKRMSFESAARNGEIKILEWMRIRTKGFFTKSPFVEIVTNIGAEHGRVAVLEWGYRNGVCLKDNPYFIRSLDRAAEKGHLEVLEWAHKNFIKIHRAYIHTAALNGHLPILKWWYALYKEDFKHDSSFFLAASREGHLDILKWLVSTEACIAWGCFNVKNMGANALEAIAWASENGLDKEKVNEYLTEFKLEKIA